MSWERIWAIVLRYQYYFLKSWDRLTDSIYWPVLDVALWGLASQWIMSQQHLPHLPLMLLTGLVFWQVIWRGSYEISVNLLEEFWNDNLVNLFATPLKKSEWMVAVMIVGILKLFITLLVSAGAVWIFYSLNVLAIGWAFLPFIAALLLSGWFIGFLSAGLIIRFGEKIQTLAWVMGWVLAPFSAVFYPVAMLPVWAQQIAWTLPTTYVFEGMRTIIAEGRVPWSNLYLSLALSAVYLALACIFFGIMFEHKRMRGLVK